MSKQERSRKAVLESVRMGYFTLKEAAEQLDISYRQIKRIWKRYRDNGDHGLVHRLRGTSSTRAMADETRLAVIARYQERYYDFGPTFAQEKLTEEGFKLSVESLRKVLIDAGLWSRKRKRKAHRRQRERKARFGDMVQIDGSIHDWFEDGRDNCLLNMVDDATGITFAQLDEGETTHVLLKCLYCWIKHYGVPNSVYVDLKSVYISPGNLYDQSEDDRQKREFLSVFERVCKRLHIKVIKAYSAQAKGRVERNHGVYQDRFVKELRLAGIKSIDAANKFLLSKYLDKINNKFAKSARDEEDGHRQAELYGDLDRILCWEYVRTVRNDMTIQFKNRHYQLEAKGVSKLRSGNKVKVCRHLDGSITIWLGEDKFNYKEIEARVAKDRPKKKECSSVERSELARRNKWRSPWSQFNPGWLKNGKVVYPPPLATPLAE